MGSNTHSLNIAEGTGSCGTGIPLVSISVKVASHGIVNLGICAVLYDLHSSGHTEVVRKIDLLLTTV